MNNIISLMDLKKIREQLKKENKKVVFTNGVFDILHSGHVDYLNKSRALGDILFVGINSDASVRKIKGEKRPILKEKERSYIVSNLKSVDYVTLFDEETPAHLIEEIVPDVLVKGADWALNKIVGRDVVEAAGGEVKTIKFVNDQSTSKIIDLVLSRYR
jgi:D-glycero-beta-D-manno-heptose 1-phosphate adenylyltransferase